MKLLPHYFLAAILALATAAAGLPVAVAAEAATVATNVSAASAAATNAVPAAVTNAASTKAENAAEDAAPKNEVQPAPSDYAAFKIIDERNIFNANRSRRSSRTARKETPKPTQIESFSFVGTMSYEKGEVAFFTGSSPEFRKAVRRDETIAGHKVAEILGNTVKLEKEGKTVEMLLGAQLRREDEGPWTMTASRLKLANSEKQDDARSGDSGEDDEVLKRLLLRKKQEEQ